MVLLGYLSKHAANISSSITFSTYLLPPPWNVILLYTQLIALGEKRDKSFVQEGEDNRNWKVDNLENEAERPRGLGAKQPGPRETWQTNNNSLRGKHVERCNSTRQLCRFYYGQNRQSFGTRLSLSLFLENYELGSTTPAPTHPRLIEGTRAKRHVASN